MSAAYESSGVVVLRLAGNTELARPVEGGWAREGDMCASSSPTTAYCQRQ